MTRESLLVRDIATFVMGQAPPGRDVNTDGVGTPFFRSGEFGSIRPVLSTWTTKPLRFSSETDVFVCVVGANAGEVNRGAEGAIGRSVGAVRPGKGVDSDFLYFFLKWSEPLLRNAAQGSAQAVLSRDDLGRIPIELPPLVEQRAIAGVLGALDDKIESNRRLARIAHDLGSSTFDAVADSRLPLESVSTIVMGSSPPGSTYNEDGEGVPFYQGVADFGDRFPGIRVFCSEPVRMAKAHDVLVSVRAPVGRINIASQRCCIGRGLAAIRSELPSVAYYALTRSHEIWEPFNAEGTVFGAIKAADLGAIKVRWPSSEEAVALERELSEIDSTIGVAFNEVQTLTSLRNALLPELLSGRLRVRDAESFLEEEL